MKAATVLALIGEIVATLPAAITTGEQVIGLINDAYARLSEALDDGEASAEEIAAAVRRIAANSAAIQALD